jgi:2-dehydro-3-deoxyphosphogluconate aldolase / (4S)-4-hydroxy-2-oxoglutarate aldolase
MLQSDWLTLLQAHRAIAVIRTDEPDLGDGMAQAVAAGGLRLIEITWNSHQPATLVEQLRQTLPHCTIGAGTLLTENDVKEAIAAGAEFLFTPHHAPKLIHLAQNAEIPIVPGALTPTEIVHAWQAGANSVKVFPAESLGGSRYIRSLQGPLGQIPLIPTGGVTIDNAAEFIQAGAIAVGLSGQLFPTSALAQKNWDLITHQAQRLTQALTAGTSLVTSRQK